METLKGEWKLTSSENFEELMKELGVGMVLRKVGNSQKPTVTVTCNGDEWALKTATTFKTTEIKFKLNEPFEEETLDGRKVNTTMTLVDNKVVQTQRDKDNNVVCEITRYINENGELVALAKAGEVLSTRVYGKA